MDINIRNIQYIQIIEILFEMLQQGGCRKEVLRIMNILEISVFIFPQPNTISLEKSAYRIKVAFYRDIYYNLQKM